MGEVKLSFVIKLYLKLNTRLPKRDTCKAFKIIFTPNSQVRFRKHL